MPSSLGALGSLGEVREVRYDLGQGTQKLESRERALDS